MYMYTYMYIHTYIKINFKLNLLCLLSFHYIILAWIQIYLYYQSNPVNTNTWRHLDSSSLVLNFFFLFLRFISLMEIVCSILYMYLQCKFGISQSLHHNKQVLHILQFHPQNLIKLVGIIFWNLLGVTEETASQSPSLHFLIYR